MAFNIKDFLTGLAVKIKSTTDGSNGEVPHHNVDSSALPTGAATQTTLAALLAKIIAAPSTEAKQDAIVALLVTQAGYLDGVETSLGALGTQTTLAAILAKIIAAPATEATLIAIDGRVDGLETLITSTNTKLDTCIVALQIIDNMVLAAGTAAIGKLAANAGVNIGEVSIAAASQNANGRAAAAASSPTVLSNEDLAEITAVKTSVQLIDDAVIADDAAFTPATTKVMVSGFQADETATDSVDEGDAGAARMTLDRKQIMTMQPHTAGGFAAPFLSLDLDESEEEVKAGAGCLYKLRITNRTTSARYVKLYDGVLAGVTVGTTTPIDTIVVPAGASADLATVLTESFGGLGLPFTTGLCLAATTGFAHADTGAPGANEVIVSAYFK